MKKIFILLLIALCLTGCSKNNNNGNSQTIEEPNYTEVTILKGPNQNKLMDYITCSLVFTPAPQYGKTGYYITATFNSKSSKYEFSHSPLTLSAAGYAPKTDIYLGDNGHAVVDLGPKLLSLGTGHFLNNYEVYPNLSITIKIYK